MKNLDESTVGGRIRKSRIESTQSLKELAAQVEVSPNYLGLVERGEKQPSRSLVKEIAMVTGVSYKWLSTGEVDLSEASESAEPAKDVPPVYASDVNPQLMLALALRSPNFSRETLATFLMVSPETIDSILAGEAVEYNAQWGHIFPVLLRGIDIREARQELQTLDAYLAQEDDRVSRGKLLEALHTYINSKAEYKIAGPVENGITAYNTENGETMSASVSRMMLEGKEPPNMKWYIAYYPFRESASKEAVEQAFRAELAFSKNSPRIGSVSIVTGSRKVYDKFCGAADAHVESCNGKWMHDPSGNVGEPAFSTFFSIILVDGNSLNVLKEYECKDAEYEAAMEEIYG